MNKTKTLTLALLALVLTACVPPKKEKDLDSTLMQYETIVRWAEWDGAVGFIAPDYLESNPISTLDLDRLRLFKVTSYTVRSATPAEDGDAFVQVVEIRMFNKTRVTEKTIIDQQLWRYDEESERWMLHSGLPNVVQRY